MKRLACLLVPLAFGGCTPPQVNDPHVVGVNTNQWRAGLSGSPSTVFDAALRVLSDSSYKIADARKDAGLIKTDYRKESDVQRGAAQLKTMSVGKDYPIHLQIMILAQGRDSSTVTITGEEMLENIGRTLPIDARTGEWRFVRGIGEAILAGVR